LHFFVAGNRRHLKCNVWVEHCKCQPSYDKPSLKWTWARHATNLKLLLTLTYMRNGFS